VREIGRMPSAAKGDIFGAVEHGLIDLLGWVRQDGYEVATDCLWMILRTRKTPRRTGRGVLVLRPKKAEDPSLSIELHGDGLVLRDGRFRKVAEMSWEDPVLFERVEAVARRVLAREKARAPDLPPLTARGVDASVGISIP
jgi:hypothetical protein